MAAEERECGCPPAIIRCAHFGNERIWLADASKIRHNCTCYVKGPRYVLHHFQGETHVCIYNCGSQAAFWAHQLLRPPYADDDLTAALEAFRAAEEQLLREE